MIHLSVYQYRSVLKRFFVYRYRSIMEHFRVPVSVVLKRFFVYRYLSIMYIFVYQYRSVLKRLMCSSIGRYWVLFCVGTYFVSVLVDTGTFYVYQYRAVLNLFMCNSISRYWKLFMYQYRSILKHLFMYQNRKILERFQGASIGWYGSGFWMPASVDNGTFSCAIIGRYWYGYLCVCTSIEDTGTFPVW